MENYAKTWNCSRLTKWRHEVTDLYADSSDLYIPFWDIRHMACEERLLFRYVDGLMLIKRVAYIFISYKVVDVRRLECGWLIYSYKICSLEY